MASMGFPAPVHGAPYQAGSPPQYVQAGHPVQYVQAGHPVQYAQPMVIQQGYQQPAPHIVHVVTQSPTPPKVYDNYRAKQSVVLGAIQITVGILSIIINIIGIILQIIIHGYFYSGYGLFFGFLGYGIWGAIFYILAGSFAIAAAKRKTSCPVIANMVLSILSAVFVWTHISFAALDVALDADFSRAVSRSYNFYGDSLVSTVQANLALSCIMLIIGLVEFVAAVWSSALACRVTCCGNTNRPQQYLTPEPHVTYDQYPDQPLGADVAYTGAPAQPIGRGVTY